MNLTGPISAAETNRGMASNGGALGATTRGGASRVPADRGTEPSNGSRKHLPHLLLPLLDTLNHNPNPGNRLLTGELLCSA